jgi:MFS family permease
MFVMIPWGKAADKFGRKSILTASFIGLLFTASGFGFSQSLWQMILLRCAAGVFSGSVV